MVASTRRQPPTGAPSLEAGSLIVCGMNMCRLFGEKEEILGYDGLSIDVWFTPQFQVPRSAFRRKLASCRPVRAIVMSVSCASSRLLSTSSMRPRDRVPRT
jgi:hypothetical protein